jgi:hypothetical protein
MMNPMFRSRWPMKLMHLFAGGNSLMLISRSLTDLGQMQLV